MRKILLALIAAVIAVVSLAFSVDPADASALTNTHKCMSLKEWRQIRANGTQSRARVTQIVGYAGTKGRTTNYSDGTVDFSVTYRQCGRPSYYTTWLSFSTEVKYGAYVWDEYDDYVCDEDYVECDWIGAWVWDDYAENGHTRTPKVDFKGSY